MISSAISTVFDLLHKAWTSPRARRWVAAGLIILYLGALFLVEARALGLIPPILQGLIPVTPFAAVDAAFGFVLMVEVIELVFALPSSLSRAVGKQFEILCLILLRAAFKELEYLPTPIAVHEFSIPVLHILANAFGALAIFILLLGYYHMHRRISAASPSRISGRALHRFVTAKKALALILFFAFIVLGLHNIWGKLINEPTMDFFHSFYTILIFSDVLLVLISYATAPDFLSMFRNSGYAVATLLIRLSLAADRFCDIALGMSAAFFAFVLTLVYFRILKLGGPLAEKMPDFNE